MSEEESARWRERESGRVEWEERREVERGRREERKGGGLRSRQERGEKGESTGRKGEGRKGEGGEAAVSGVGEDWSVGVGKEEEEGLLDDVVRFSLRFGVNKKYTIRSKKNHIPSPSLQPNQLPPLPAAHSLTRTLSCLHGPPVPSLALPFTPCSASLSRLQGSCPTPLSPLSARCRIHFA